jgi:flavin-binding protein dodecin
MQSEHVYKIVELVGSSTTGIEDAIQNAISRASETLRNLDWFEVRETRGRIVDGSVGWYQVTLGIGFRVDEGESVGRE